MRQQHRCFMSHSRISVRSMCGDLLVTHVHKLHLAVFHRGEHRNVGVTAQPEHMAHASPFQVTNQVICDGVFHGFTVSVSKNSSTSCPNTVTKRLQHAFCIRPDSRKQVKRLGRLRHHH